jgi:hypothetical protein
LGLIAFLIGETICGVNFIVYQHASLVSEYIHSYGMVLAFGFFTYSSVEIVDQRLLRKNNRDGAVQRTAQLVLLLMALVSFFPLTANVTPESYTTRLFRFPYSYARFNFYQWYETRALPLLALTCLIVAFISLFNSKEAAPRLAKIFFSAGVGALGFSLFRLILASVFAENLVWFEFWEEASELTLTSTIGLVLWQFRETLLEKTPLLDALSNAYNQGVDRHPS